MIAYFEQFVNSLKRPKILLILANILLVVVLIFFSNLKVLPIKNFGDFAFFTGLFLIFALYRPGWAFLFFVGTIALENISLAPGSLGIAVRPYQFFGALSILAVVVRKIAGRLNFQLVKISWPDYLVIFFAVAGFVANLNKGGASIKQSMVVFSFAALYFLVRNFVQNIGDLKKIIPFFLSSAAVVVFYGLWQNVQFMRGLPHFEAMAGRPNSTFTEPDWLGIYLVLILAVIYSILYKCHFERSKAESRNLIQDNTRRSLDKLGMTFLCLFLVLCFILLILTVSRSAWLGALGISIMYQILCIKYFVWDNQNWKGFFQQLLFLAMAIIGSLLIVYFFNLTSFQLFNRAQSTGTGLQKITISCKSDIPLPEKINHSEELIQYGCRHINLEEIKLEEARGYSIKEIYRTDPNVNIRKEIYQKSWAEIKKHPVGGIGWGNISNILGKDERGAGLNSSNILLEVWLGTGIFGLAAFVILLAVILLKALKNIIKQGGMEIKITGIFFLLGFLAIIIPNLFNAGIFLGIVWLFLGLANLKFI